jgi:hypothetical protein
MEKGTPPTMEEFTDMIKAELQKTAPAPKAAE